MGEVVDHPLDYLSGDDVAAVTAHLRCVPAPRICPRPHASAPNPAWRQFLQLPGSTSSAGFPRNPRGRAASKVNMPGFGRGLYGCGLAAIANYVSGRFGGKAATLKPEDVVKLRKGG